MLLHAGLIYGLYSGLLTRTAELLVPVAILSQLIEPPRPKVEPPEPKITPPPPRLSPPPRPSPQLPAQPPQEVKRPVAKTPAMAVAPLPIAVTEPTPAPNAPTGSTAPPLKPAPAAPPLAVAAATPGTAPAAAPAAPVAAPAAPVVQLPSSDADYLQNPSPPYPAISRRLNEQGKTVVRVLIGADGQPQRAEIGKSSGFARLDEAAMATVMRWRYVPGKRGGVADAMWFNVPINWVLE